MKEEETWQGDDWEFGRPSEEPSHTQTHNCSQSCANELAVTTHLGGYQHALIELADALTRHRCSTSLPQCHNAGRGSRGENQGAGCRARRQIENARNRLTSAIAQWGAFSLLTHTQHQVPLLNVMPGYAGPNPYSS